jgi:UDP-arabinose 4-epimerase
LQSIGWGCFVPVTFDNLSTGHAENVRWGPLVVGDILDRYALDSAFELYHPRAVIHFAGLAYVGDSFRILCAIIVPTLRE